MTTDTWSLQVISFAILLVVWGAFMISVHVGRTTDPSTCAGLVASCAAALSLLFGGAALEQAAQASTTTAQVVYCCLYTTLV